MEVLDYFFTNVIVHSYENYTRDSFQAFYRDYAQEIITLYNNYINDFKGEESDSEFSLNYFTLAFDALKLFPEFRQTMLASQHKELEIWTSVIKSAREKGEIKTNITDLEIAEIFIFLSDGMAMHMIMEGVKIDDMVAPFLNLWDKFYETIKA